MTAGALAALYTPTDIHRAADVGLHIVRYRDMKFSIYRFALSPTI